MGVMLLAGKAFRTISSHDTARRHARPGPAQLGGIGQRARHRLSGAEPALRALPPQGQRRPPARGRGHWRSGARPEARRRVVPVGKRRRSFARSAGCGRSGRLHANGPQRLARGARGVGRSAHRRQHARPVSRNLPAAAGRCADGHALRHRRLQRLLHEHPPRHNGGQDVPARQPAVAQLPVGAHRLPRPQQLHRAQRPAGAAAARPGEAA